MASQHLKNSRVLFAIRKMKIKTTLIFCLTSVRMVKINSTDDRSRTCGWRARGTLVKPLCKSIWRILRKLANDTLEEPVVLHLWPYYPTKGHLHNYVYSRILDSQMLETTNLSSWRSGWGATIPLKFVFCIYLLYILFTASASSSPPGPFLLHRLPLLSFSSENRRPPFLISQR